MGRAVVTETYAGGGIYFTEDSKIKSHYGIKYHTGRYIYGCVATVTFNYSRTIVKSVDLHIDITSKGYEFDHSLEQQFIDELNRSANPSNIISKNIHLIARLKVIDFAENLSQEDYESLLNGIYAKWFN